MRIEIKFFEGALPSPDAGSIGLEPGAQGKAGAWAEFTGTVREMEKGEKIPALRYEIYHRMAKKVLAQHVEELGKKYGLLAARFWHREGLVPVGESSVYIAIAAPHRKEAFAAIAELLDRLKSNVPIWKIEAEIDLPPKLEVIPPALDSMTGVWKLLAERVGTLGEERVPLDGARHRILREHVKADADQPPFDRSAVDGYAIIPGQVPAKYRVIGVVKAGEIAARAPGPGEALRIFTGASVPAPGLAVVMQENVRVEGDFISLDHRLLAGENVRVKGGDAQLGNVILSAGSRLSAAELAILASVGMTRPLVNALPRVAHATTGDEIVPPDTVPRPGQIRNTNQILISTLLQNAGVPLANIYQEHWGDDAAQASIRVATEPFANADIILISGGASVGEHDYTARLLEEAGFELVVRKVNLRPGRPLLVGFRGNKVAFGLPGNPVSHFVCFALFVRQALELLMSPKALRQPRPRFHTLALSQPLAKAANSRPTLWPARYLYRGPVLSLEPLPWSNSGNLGALAGANALIFVPANTPEIAAGQPVRFLYVPNTAQL